MKLALYQIDTFTSETFGGNPACVVPLDEWLPDELLFKITQENAVAETAFFIQQGSQFHLRWFTPEIEMDLCGHATLATAHCLKSILNHTTDKFVFQTLSGELTVEVKNDVYYLDFPSRMPTTAQLPSIIDQALNIKPKVILKSRDYVLVYETEVDIKNIKINKQLFDQINLDPGGVIVTAPGKNCDFVSRYFTPQSSILEDPVTGSSHSTLTPFWSKRLNKKSLSADQLSKRGGSLKCLDNGNRVIVSGQAKIFSKATFVLK